MSEILDFLGSFILLIGSIFLFLGGLGLVRMPDVFNRIQAGTKATTLGTLLVLLGAGLLQPEWGFKLLLIGVFLLFTNPLSSQILAHAAHKMGVYKSSKTKVDHLAESGDEPHV
ncbi:MAG: Na+/H+ antiporter subunit G [Gammaproteobacteria bacterium]|nr:Na+/H+ antiporter subunit G [Gammaproteobacteria bacterium]